MILTGSFHAEKSITRKKDAYGYGLQKEKGNEQPGMTSAAILFPRTENHGPSADNFHRVLAQT